MTGGNININDSSFDGFVIPNGKTFSCASDKFKTACRLYAGNENATQFTVPALPKFFKCDPGLPASTMSPMASIPGRTVFLGHSHDGKVTLDSPVEMQVDHADFHLTTGLVGAGVTKSVKDDGVLIAPGDPDGQDANDEKNPWMSYDDYPDNCKPELVSINLTATMNDGFTCSTAGNDDVES